MKKIVLALTLLVSLSSIAGIMDCNREVKTYFAEQHAMFSIESVLYIDQIAAHTSQPYFQGEIWNNSDQNLAVYEIQSFFMAEFTHVALVQEDGCIVKNLIEVGFE